MGSARLLLLPGPRAPRSGGTSLCRLGFDEESPTAPHHLALYFLSSVNCSPLLGRGHAVRRAHLLASPPSRPHEAIVNRLPKE
jgi:hypothetical protein